MKFCAFLAICSVAMARCADLDGIRIEQASAGKPYDFIVHVKNVPDYGYNPAVPEDRAQMALAAVKQDCPVARVVGQQVVSTEIYGITSSKPDYIVFVNCR
jgi:hypothetical protein